MKTFIRLSILCAWIVISNNASAQICDPTTPVFYVNLSGQPNGVWVSPNTPRAGFCCGATAPDKCVEFVITLDSNANGIKFNIISGAVPPGALFYQVACGPPVQVGQPLCLNGPGPHYLTFCKPGNNNNVYSITSLPQPSTYGSQWVSQACSGSLGVNGLIDTSITWTSIPPNPVYNSFLSCTNDCPNVSITPSGTGVPAFIDYQVCGYVVGGCFPYFYCDTMRVNFVNNLAVDITPANPVICYGMPNIPITANVSGGLAPYHFLWNTGDTSQTITVGPGTYTVSLQDSMSCSISYDTLVVTGVPTMIVADAGPDNILCINKKSIALGGIVNTASGGIWSGGNGIYNPNNTTLTAGYIPSLAEIQAGFVNLVLTTTGNMGCPADMDTIVISIVPNPMPSISGNNSVCASAIENYTAPLVSGINYNWTVTGGSVISNTLNAISVLWGATGNGSISLTEMNTSGCDSTVIMNVIIHPQPAPVILGPNTSCTTTTINYTVANPVAGNIYNWSVTGGTISGTSTNPSVNIAWTVPGTANIILTESNSFGCDSTVQYAVTVLTMPTPIINGPVNMCAGQTATYSTMAVSGNTYAWAVTGGNILSNANNIITVQWPTAGNGTVTLTENNISTCSVTVSTNIFTGPQPAPVILGPNKTCTTTTINYTVANPVAGNNYSWSVTGGSISGPSTNPSVNISWTFPGTAIITLTESNSYGCDSTVQFTVTVLTMPTPQINGPVNMCAGQTATYSTMAVSGNTYTWAVTGGTILSNANNIITVQWPSAGNGTVTLTENNTSTCSVTVSTNIVTGPQPAPVILGPNTTCTTTTISYTVANPVAGNIYNWSVSGGTISGTSTNPSVNISFTAPGTATITLTESNSFGCDSTVQYTVTVLTMPTPVINGPINMCTGQTATYSTTSVTGNTYAWNVTGGTILTNANNIITVQWPTAGNGNVTLTENNTSTCSITVSANVITGPQPAPVILGPNKTCTTTTTNYTLASPVTANSYSWTVTGGIIIGSSTGYNINVNWTIPGQGTITVTENNSFGCTGTVTYPVNVLTNPAPIISGSRTACAGEIITYTTPLINGNTYTWTVTGGNIIVRANNSITVQWPSAGNGTVTVSEFNTLTCNTTTTINVVTGIQPAPVLTGSSTVCTTTNTQYAIQSPVTGNTYSWTVTGGIISGSSSGTLLSVTWSNPGNGTITVTELNSSGCDSTVQLAVNILVMPSPAISGPVNACAGQTISYSSNLVNGNTYNWSVSGGTMLNSNNNNSLIQWPAAGNGTITLTESNSLSCSVTVTLNVTTGQQPAPVISGPAIICTAEYSSYNVLLPNSNDSYIWSVTGGNIIGATNGSGINVFWNTAGMQTISVTESNASGCDSTITFIVDVRLKPAPSLTGSPVNCEMDLASYAVQNMPFHSYFWTVTGGSVVGSIVGNSIQVLWNAPGQGRVEVRVVSPLGCDSTVAKNVLVNPLPAPNISGPPVICENETAVYITPLAVNNTYSWTVSNATITGSGNQNSLSLFFNVTGMVSITLTEITSSGCSRTVPFMVNVNSKPAVLINGSGIGCISSKQYTFQSISQPGINYLWSVNGGSITSGNGTSAITVQWNSSGLNNVALLATNMLTGCDSAYTVAVLVDSLIPPVISAASLSGCSPVSISFTGNSLNSFYNYTWNFGDGTGGTGPFPAHNYYIPGNYNVQLIATNNTGCADTVTGIITVYPDPVSSFITAYETDIYYVSLSTLTLGNNSTGANQYWWNFGNGDTSSAFEPNYQYTLPGNYEISLFVTNQFGCTSISSQEIEVKVPEILYIPNAFTPNNDMVNDYFSVSGLNIVTLKVSIFNRWGQQIFTSDVPSFKWDGNYNGGPAAEGVYVYSIDAKGFHGEKFRREGTVSLIR